VEIVSGRIGEPQVHFEAPPSTRVPDEMARFLKWFNRSGSAARAVGQ
jgi:Fic family protein